MRIKYVKMNQELINKATEERYVVTQKLDDGNFLLQKLEEGVLKEEYKTLTGNNDIAFRLAKDPNPITEPEGNFTAVDGILLCDGEPAMDTQGEIEVVSVVGKLPGAVVLATKAENGLLLKLYNPYLDQFIPFELEVKQEPQMVTAGKYAVLSCLETKDVTEEQDNGTKVTKTKLVNGMLYLLTRKGLKDKLGLPFIPDGDIQEAGHNLYIGGQLKELDMDDNIVGETHAYVKFTYGEFDHMPTLIEEPAVITKSFGYGEVFKGKNVMLYGGRKVHTKKLAELADYPYLIDITSKGNVTRFAFTDDAPEPAVKYLVQTRTKDRGNIFTVE